MRLITVIVIYRNSNNNNDNELKEIEICVYNQDVQVQQQERAIVRELKGLREGVLVQNVGEEEVTDALKTASARTLQAIDDAIEVRRN